MTEMYVYYSCHSLHTMGQRTDSKGCRGRLSGATETSQLGVQILEYFVLI